MTKIYYDNSRKILLENSLENSNNKVRDALNYGRSISVPSDFSKRSDITNCIQCLIKAQDTIRDSQKWLSKLDSSFQNHDSEAYVRIEKIDNLKIKNRDLLIK